MSQVNSKNGHCKLQSFRNTNDGIKFCRANLLGCPKKLTQNIPSPATEVCWAAQLEKVRPPVGTFQPELSVPNIIRGGCC